MKIAICTNFVSPYRAPVFSEIAKQSGADVRVFVSTRMEQDRLWNAPLCDRFRVVRSRTITRTRVQKSARHGGFKQVLERHIPIGLPSDLCRYAPDVILSGELGVRTLMAMATARVLNVPVIPWTYHPVAQAESAHAALGIKRALARRAPAIIGMGTQARQVLRSLGCHDQRIFDAWNAADTNAIERRIASSVHARNVDKIRARYSNQRLAVVVGRLVPMKGIEQLLAAWNRLAPKIRKGWRLVFIGSGPLYEKIEDHSDLGIHAIGHIDPLEMADWYAAADLHIFASMGDPWGLVVNEAMQCATPTLCSTLAGCYNDLVRDGINNLAFDPALPTDRVAQSLARSLMHHDLTGMGRRAAADIRSITPASMARGMLRAVDFVHETERSRQWRAYA